jgi:thiol-disulfide isomerase/thioredoxin
MKKGLALVFCLMLCAFAGAQTRPDYRKKGAPVPPFIIEQANGKQFGNSVLKPGKPVLIAIFSPQCDHCSLALDSLQHFGKRLDKTQVVLVTEARNKPELKKFLKDQGFDTVAAFRQAGIDKGNLIYDIYTYGLLPQFNIYNAQHKLVKSFTGNFPLDSLKMFLH